ncbi:tellurium resistance protein [Streptomyces sp. NPDC007818]|uniref:tellurium resistance protein n=1 Tax=Streptomyces sp. NPDC007818 TaxID=3364780 RepID=UPI0036C0CFD5
MTSDRQRGVIRLKPKAPGGPKPKTPGETPRPPRPQPSERTGGETRPQPSQRTGGETPRPPHPRAGEHTGREALLTRATPLGLVSGRGVLQANLNWSAATGADLDLGCLIELADGSIHVIQALGDSFGALDAPPYTLLDQDDRTGASSDGETVRTNLEYRAKFRRILVYTFVYEGAVDFRSLGATVTVTAASGRLRILLDDAPAGATACAIALITAGNGGMDVRREVRWFTATPWESNQQLIDRAYGFGVPWVWGTKD